MKKLILPLLILLLASPCANAQTVAKKGSRHVTAEVFGDTWPLTVNEGILSCYLSGAVVISITGKGTFTLNGLALNMMDARPSLGWRDLPRTLWADERPLCADNPAGGSQICAQRKKSMKPLIDAGLDLCD